MAVYTWTGATNTAFETQTNWTPTPPTFPQATDTIIFSGSNNNPCVIANNRSVQGVSFSGAYTASLTLTANLTVGTSGLTLSSTTPTILGTGALILGSTCSITPNGGNWSGNLQIGNSSSIVVTLASGFSVLGTLTFQNVVSLSGNVNITALGNVNATSGCIVSTSNLSQTTLIIGGATSTWSGDGRIGCNVNFANASGAFVISGSVNFGSIVAGSATPQLQATNGTVTTTGSTIGICGNCSLSVQNITFNNVNFRNLNQAASYTITLNQDLNIGGTLNTGFDGGGSHILARTGTQTVNLQGSLTIGVNNQNCQLSAAGSGAEIIMLGNASGTSTLSAFPSGVPGGGQNWCNVDLTINSGSNTVALSSVNTFNFGNPATSAIIYRTFKHLSGTFTSTSSTINLANSILNMGSAQFNNVRIYPLGAVTLTTTVQLVSNTTITGNLITGITTAVNSGTAALTNAGTATTLTIQGGLTLGSASGFQEQFPLNSSAISLNFVGSGTLQGRSMCNANINLNGGTYTIADLFFGNPTSSPVFVPTMKYNGGTVTCSGTLFTSNVKLDLASVQLNNLTPTLNALAAGLGAFTLTLIASNILRVNGNFTTGVHYKAAPSSNSGLTVINADATTPNAQIDVYGNVNMSSNIGALTGTSGTSRIYMKGTGTFTTNGISSCNIDVFIQGVTVTLGNIWMGGGKKLEYVSGTLITAGSLTTIANSSTATIKSLGQTWGDIGIRGGATLIVDGNLTCRDLITYASDVGSSVIQGSGFTVTMKRNLTLSNANPVIASGVSPIDKLIMDASDGGTGTWTSGGGRLQISLDLNAPSRTIVVSGTVNFGSATTQRLKWFSGTIMTTTASSLVTASATLDLGNQIWGSLITGSNASINLESDATFTNVSLVGGGTVTYINGITSPKTLTVKGNLTINQPTGTFTGFQLVEIVFDGNGIWSNGVAGYLNANVSLAGGTTTLSGTVTWGNNVIGIGGPKTLQAVGGTLNGGSSTFVIPTSNTIDIDLNTQGSFNNVTTGQGITLTLEAQLGATGTLLLNNTGASVTTFASSANFGWSVLNFTHGGGNTTCILNSGSIYNINGTFTMLGSNASTRAKLYSSKRSAYTGTANGTTLTINSAVSGSPIEADMILSQASGDSVGGFATIYPNRPVIDSGSGLSWTLDSAYPVSPATGPIAMESGLPAFLNLAFGTGQALILFAETKDINSIGGQTIYAFQSFLDAPGTTPSLVSMYRTINWNSLAPPVSPIGIGYISVT